MTVKELSQLYHLKREIELCERQLHELEEQRGSLSISQDGQPRAKGNVQSQVEQLAMEIVDLQAIICAKEIQYIHEKNRLERYISEIPDSVTRQIFRLRFEECLSWDQVTARMGSEISMDGVRRRVYRYLSIDDQN